VHFHCDLHHDPFIYMEEHNKTYGFTITMLEFEKTIPTLWDATREFIDLHPEYVAPDNAMGYLSYNGGETYNLCHFWSNFEIADLDFWRSDAYQAYFDYLDQKGGFYYEVRSPPPILRARADAKHAQRWGDAPVHSIAAALFLPKERIHFFREIGYFHHPFTHCPRERDVWSAGRCSCNPDDSFGECAFPSRSALACVSFLSLLRPPQSASLLFPCNPLPPLCCGYAFASSAPTSVRVRAPSLLPAPAPPAHV
jgi:alpha 1,2-mannosyltransferase